jgi:beta-glucanase (GH16 family)
VGIKWAGLLAGQRKIWLIVGLAVVLVIVVVGVAQSHHSSDKHQAAAAVIVTPNPADSSSTDQAADVFGWGAPVASQSDEYNNTSVDLNKWGLFGTSAGETTGCGDGFNGHGQRCGSQTTEGGGYLSVTGTADGKTGGIWARTTPFKYGRVEVRERAVPLAKNGGEAYHAVPLIWPEDGTVWEHAEIDFAERDVAAKSVGFFVHHGDVSNCSADVDSTKFHNYAIDWEPTSVTWYIDGKLQCTIKSSSDSFSRTNGGAQMDMFPDTGTKMQPSREDVDWIRMYANASTQYESAS